MIRRVEGHGGEAVERCVTAGEQREPAGRNTQHNGLEEVECLCPAHRLGSAALLEYDFCINPEKFYTKYLVT